MTDNEVTLLNKIYDLAKENRALIQKLNNLLIGDVEKVEQPGLVERVRKIEEWIKKIDGYIYVAIGAVIVDSIGLGFLILKQLIGF